MLRTQISDALKVAMKEKNGRSVSTLRLILAAVKDRDISARAKGNQEGINHAELLSLLQSMIKQRTESIELYKKGGRQELLNAEEAEIKIIDSFLPKQLNEEETKKICKELIEKTGASSIKDMGKIMGELKKQYSDSIDFAKVNMIVKELLSQ